MALVDDPRVLVVDDVATVPDCDWLLGKFSFS